MTERIVIASESAAGVQASGAHIQERGEMLIRQGAVLTGRVGVGERHSNGAKEARKAQQF